VSKRCCTGHTRIAVGLTVWKILNLNHFLCWYMSWLFLEQQAIFLLAILNCVIEVVIRNTNRFFIVMNLAAF